MENLEFPKPLRTSIYSLVVRCQDIDKRTVAVESIHNELDTVAAVLKKAIKFSHQFSNYVMTGFVIIKAR